MLNNISRANIVAAWIGLVGVISATAVAAGAHIGAEMGVLCLVVAALPPAVLTLLWHRTPSTSMNELLYAPSTAVSEKRR